jgi:hypothetical protein
LDARPARDCRQYHSNLFPTNPEHSEDQKLFAAHDLRFLALARAHDLCAVEARKSATAATAQRPRISLTQPIRFGFVLRMLARQRCQHVALS